MRAVNLLPKDVGSSRKLNPVAVLGVAGATVLASALAAAVVMTGGSVSSKQATLDDLRVELEVIPKPAVVEEPGASLQLAGEESARLTALSTALAERVAWDRVLRQFALVLPDDVWLTSLNAVAPVAGAGTGAAATPPAAPAATPTGFTISGYTYSHEAVARLLSRLAVIPDLENVQLQRSAVTAGTSKVVEFTVVAGVRNAGATS
jgi:Tfp pilus assembly protein PilN